jgi:hypothetical protein
MKTIAAFALAALIVTAVFAMTARSVVAATPSAASLRITSASALNDRTNCWTVRLSNGATLQVEKRAFDTGGHNPAVGGISGFRDQHWLPILGYFGYATFVQGGVTYYGYR